MALEIATNSAAVLPGLITGMNDLGAAIMYLIPVSVVGFSFYNAIDFNKSNGVFFASIEDILDRDIFQKMVIPLYDAITNNVFGDTFNDIRNERTTDKKRFLEGYEAAKKERLKSVDFTFLNEAIDFQTAIKSIIESRKNHLDFLRLKKATKKNLIVSGIAGVISLIFLIGADVASFFFALGELSNFLLAAYGITLLVSLSSLGLYVKDKITLDNFA